MADEGGGAAASDASSHFAIEPVSASVLRRQETRRRDVLASLGPVTVGCGEVDDYVLLGGLDRGHVAGLSAEDEGVGLRIALQVVARGLVRGDAMGRPLRVMVVTTQPVAVVLPVLRDAVKVQLAEKGVEEAKVKGVLRGCLERVEVSRVFDLEGLWEVLEDLDAASKEASPAETEAESLKKDAPSPAVQPALEPMVPERLVLPELKPARLEIADSEDEGGFSSASSSPLSSAPASTPQDRPASPEHEAPQQPTLASEPPPPKASTLPDIILITHFSSILTTLFTRRESKAAHNTLHLLSSHLRHLSRSLPSNPLIMLLNTTASSHLDPGPHAAGGARRPSEKPLDPTLRSIFNPSPMAVPGYRHGSASRKNKPSYGMVFTQLLDMHLLCTKLPREAEDAERLYAPGPAQEPGAVVRYVWVVEVLLDEIGTWSTEPGGRRFREQRWGAVDFVDGRLVDAFAPPEPKVYGEIRLAAGFGGPRV